MELVKKDKRFSEKGIIGSPKVVNEGVIWGLSFPPDKGGLMT